MGMRNSQQRLRRSDPGPGGRALRRFRWISVAVALALSMVLAGSSAPGPSRTLIAFCAAWLALIVGALSTAPGALPRGAVMLGLAIIAVPLLQVVPLPLALTASLPGHEPVARAAEFLGSGAWRPFSLDVERTWQSFLAASGCVALFWATVMLDRGERLRIVHVILVVALVGLLLGVAQSTSAAGGLYFQPDAVPGTLTGFFGNRNHEGVMLAMAAALAVVLITPEDGRERKLMLLALALVFASGVIATRSRAAILVLVAASALLAVQRGRTPGRIVLSGLAVCGVLSALIWLTPIGRLAFGRFLGVGGAFDRVVIWRESLVALREVFPAGTGMGTFAQAYVGIESLESVSRVYINQAHSEVLQVPIELGLPGVMVVLGVIGFWLLRLVRLGRDGDLVSQGALGCLALPMLHSLADYPLRAVAMAAVASVLLAFAFPARSEGAGAGGPVDRPGRRWGLVALGCAMIALVAQQGVAAMLTASGRAGAAARVMPFSAGAHLVRARQLAGDERSGAEARAHAARALWLNAYSAPAWALLGYSELKRGDLARADQAFLSAARLGWRDHLVQAYVFQRAVETGAAQTAASAADALLRRNDPRRAEIMGQMAALLVDPRFREALAARLVERPSWRGDFFARLTPADRADAVAQFRLFQSLARQGMALQGGDAGAYLGRAEASAGMDMLLGAWQEVHAQSGDPRNSPVDGSFQAMDGSLFPFGWQADGARVAQIIGLGPGSHELTYRLRSGAREGAASASLRCRSSRRDLLAPIGRTRRVGMATEVTVAFAIPARRCGLQVLSFSAASLNEVEPGSIEIRKR